MVPVQLAFIASTHRDHHTAQLPTVCAHSGNGNMRHRRPACAWGGEGQSYWTRGRRRAILKDSRVCAIVFPAMNPIAAAAAAGSASEVTMLFDVMTCVTAGRHHVITDDVPC